MSVSDVQVLEGNLLLPWMMATGRMGIQVHRWKISFGKIAWSWRYGSRLSGNGFEIES